MEGDKLPREKERKNFFRIDRLTGQDYAMYLDKSKRRITIGNKESTKGERFVRHSCSLIDRHRWTSVCLTGSCSVEARWMEIILSNNEPCVDGRERKKGRKQRKGIERYFLK